MQSLRVKSRFAFFAASAGLLLAGTVAPVYAHHSFAAEYDEAKPITLPGSVTKVDWMNPHARFCIDVKDAAGNVFDWELELGSPNGLAGSGWTRNSVKQGDEVSVDGYLAKAGSNLAGARYVKLADGRKLFAGSARFGPEE